MKPVNIDGKKCVFVESEHIEENGKKYIQQKYKAIKDGEEFVIRVQYRKHGEEW